MYISEISEIKNFRNLINQSIYFNDKINFLIGENNIGKTNVLELINIFFSKGKFEEDDFFDVYEAIEIKVSIKFQNDELAFIKDNFNYENGETLTIIGRQCTIDEPIVYSILSQGEKTVSISSVRALNAIYYYSNEVFCEEIKSKKSAIVKFFNFITQANPKWLSFQKNQLIKKSKLESIIVPILERIYNLQTTRTKVAFESRILNIENKKYVPLFLLLDEPEIHHHPYSQRGVVRKLENLINNDNDIFVELLNTLYELDGIRGQIFISTHSPNMLLNNYKQFIRIFNPIGKPSSSLEIISGSKIELNSRLYKHMLHNFIYLKEAMFSKCIVFVEGDTENGAMPVFAKRMGLDVDDKGIGFVKLDGADSVKYCMKLYKEFGIKVMAIIDRDKKSHYFSEPDIFFTDGKDFEEDIYNNFNLEDYFLCSKEINSISTFVKILKNEGYTFDPRDFMANPKILTIPRDIQDKIMKENKEKQLMVLRGSKNTLKGYILAKYVSTIPSAFKKVMEKLINEID